MTRLFLKRRGRCHVLVLKFIQYLIILLRPNLNKKKHCLNTLNFKQCKRYYLR